MRAFLSYYKWHIFFISLFLVCASIFLIGSCNKSEPDLTINVISSGRINVQTFNDKKEPLIKLMTHDVDGDGKKTIQLFSYPYDRQQDMNEAFELLAEPKSSDIIITTEKTLTSFKDKSIFMDMREFISDIDSDKYTTLKDSSGKVYAVSLNKNDLIKDLGFFDTTDLYITVIADNGEEVSKQKKNARNIALAIIKESNF